MLPDHVLSTLVRSASFTPPRDGIRNPLIDYSWGGMALNDPSEGLRAKAWMLECIVSGITGAFVLSAPGIAPIEILSKPHVKSVSLAFDQNMRVAVAYDFTDATLPELYWFDSTVGYYVALQLTAGSITPRCMLDDSRDMQSAHSDILLTYLRAGTLYFREQRDRYQVEYALRTGLDAYEIGQFGMNRKHRMQWQLAPRPMRGL